eukprot:TRINITY_DN2701_c0_g1_i1.p1 TRINITY_DN2701_c0_g1~~TRINITY_DN2701_c0_g1_i1.p1  ORF type:complete len:572 (+),score=200.26 TRINITY_DN2701_c0_g1_i1:280-1995(+)
MPFDDAMPLPPVVDDAVEAGFMAPVPRVAMPPERPAARAVAAERRPSVQAAEVPVSSFESPVLAASRSRRHRRRRVPESDSDSYDSDTDSELGVEETAKRHSWIPEPVFTWWPLGFVGYMAVLVYGFAQDVRNSFDGIDGCVDGSQIAEMSYNSGHAVVRCVLNAVTILVCLYINGVFKTEHFAPTVHHLSLFLKSTLTVILYGTLLRDPGICGMTMAEAILVLASTAAQISVFCVIYNAEQLPQTRPVRVCMQWLLFVNLVTFVFRVIYFPQFQLSWKYNMLDSNGVARALVVPFSTLFPFECVLYYVHIFPFPAEAEVAAEHSTLLPAAAPRKKHDRPGFGRFLIRISCVICMAGFVFLMFATLGRRTGLVELADVVYLSLSFVGSVVIAGACGLMLVEHRLKTRSVGRGLRRFFFVLVSAVTFSPPSRDEKRDPGLRTGIQNLLFVVAFVTSLLYYFDGFAQNIDAKETFAAFKAFFAALEVFLMLIVLIFVRQSAADRLPFWASNVAVLFIAANISFMVLDIEANAASTFSDTAKTQVVFYLLPFLLEFRLQSALRFATFFTTSQSD